VLQHPIYKPPTISILLPRRGGELVEIPRVVEEVPAGTTVRMVVLKPMKLKRRDDVIPTLVRAKQ
jgi:hypothetical protein